jgi:hypothetical protein
MRRMQHKVLEQQDVSARTTFTFLTAPTEFHNYIPAEESFLGRWQSLSWYRNSLPSMEHSTECSQVPATSYAKPDESNPHSYLNIRFNNILPSMRLSPEWSVSFCVPTKILHAFLMTRPCSSLWFSIYSSSVVWVRSKAKHRCAKRWGRMTQPTVAWGQWITPEIWRVNIYHRYC